MEIISSRKKIIEKFSQRLKRFYEWANHPAEPDFILFQAKAKIKRLEEAFGGKFDLEIRKIETPDENGVIYLTERQAQLPRARVEVR